MDKMDTEDQVEQACEWIVALAQNDFEQTTNVMCRGVDGDSVASWVADFAPESGMCCLGVLRSMAHPDVPEGDKDGAFIEPAYLLDSTEPAVWEREEYGLTNLGVTYLVGYNDMVMLSFPQIAAKILAQPHNHFVQEVAEGIEEYFFGGGSGD